MAAGRVMANRSLWPVVPVTRSRCSSQCPSPVSPTDPPSSPVLDRLVFDEGVLDWVREALTASHEDERRAHDEAVVRLQARYAQLQSRLDTMYVDKLDGRIDPAAFDRMAAAWRSEQDECLRL